MRFLVRRKVKKQKEFILSLLKKIKNGEEVQKNNYTLITLFTPLLKKLSTRYSRVFNIEKKLLYDFLEIESFSLFLEYDYKKNDNFPAYFKTLLDKRLLYFCQKHNKIKSFYDDNVDVDNLVIEKHPEFEEKFEISKLKELEYLLNLDKSKLFRKVVYYSLFRGLKEIEVAKKLNYSQSRICQIIIEIKKEIKEDLNE